MVRVRSLPTFSKPVEGATTGICSHKEFLKLDDLIPKQMKKLEEPFVSPQIFFFFFFLVQGIFLSYFLLFCMSHWLNLFITVSDIIMGRLSERGTMSSTWLILYLGVKRPFCKEKTVSVQLIMDE